MHKLRLIFDKYLDPPTAEVEANYTLGSGSSVDVATPVGGAGYTIELDITSTLNDGDPESHYNNAGYTLPLGIEVHQTLYASDGPYHENNGVYIQYKLYNKGSNQITGFYFAFWMDPDLGYMRDDLVGCDTTNGVFFCYNGAAHDSAYGWQPPAMGVRVLGGPVVPSIGDTAIFDGNWMPSFRNLPMMSFRRIINGTDPGSASETYANMRGRNSDGSDYTYNDHVLRFMCSGEQRGWGAIPTPGTHCYKIALA